MQDSAPQDSPHRTLRNAPLTFCGNPLMLTLVTGTSVPGGQVSIANTADSIYILVQAQTGNTLAETRYFVGNCDNVPRSESDAFAVSVAHAPGTTSYLYVIAQSDAGPCPCVAVSANIETPSGPLTVWGSEDPAYFGPIFSRYCANACPPNTPQGPPPPPACSVSANSHRTHTQAQWGACGGVAGNYLQANFAAAFPNGVQVGNPNGRRLRFTNIWALRNALPASGTAKALTNTQTNPGCVNNTLAGQMVALALNLGFDAHNASFGTSATPLATLVIDGGTFQGWTVQQLFNLGNQALGNQGTGGFSFSQINAAVTRINELFSNGGGTGYGGYGGYGGGGCGYNNGASFNLICP